MKLKNRPDAGRGFGTGVDNWMGVTSRVWLIFGEFKFSKNEETITEPAGYEEKN
jgi:hypothetical protein